MTIELTDISIIIPVRAGDSSWRKLVSDLIEFDCPSEVIIAATEPMPQDFPVIENWRWLVCSRGRAQQMNTAARTARQKYLWFLHADTRLKPKNFSTLLASLRETPEALHFFQLKFASLNPAMLLTELGVKFRAGKLKLPFGDQGFCVSKFIFDQLGQYSTDYKFGEDHHFVWKCHLTEVPVVEVASSLKTSARKYESEGWLRTTGDHLFWTTKQAAPFVRELLWRKLLLKKALK